MAQHTLGLSIFVFPLSFLSFFPFCVHFFHLAFIQRPGRFIHLIAQCLDRRRRAYVRFPGSAECPCSPMRTVGRPVAGDKSESALRTPCRTRPFPLVFGAKSQEHARETFPSFAAGPLVSTSRRTRRRSPRLRSCRIAREWEAAANELRRRVIMHHPSIKYIIKFEQFLECECASNGGAARRRKKRTNYYYSNLSHVYFNTPYIMCAACVCVRLCAVHRLLARLRRFGRRFAAVAGRARQMKARACSAL